MNNDHFHLNGVYEETFREKQHHKLFLLLVAFFSETKLVFSRAKFFICNFDNEPSSHTYLFLIKNKHTKYADELAGTKTVSDFLFGQYTAAKYLQFGFNTRIYTQRLISRL